MKKRYKFNMVEIALAIAVISIGISAILVLFPIGINASRAAMDETSYTDVAESVANFVRGKYLDNWRTQFNSWRTNFKNWQANPTTPMPELIFEAPTSASLGWGTERNADTPSGNPTNIAGYTNVTTTPNSGLQSYGSGNFRFTKIGENGEEIFSATVKIWSPPDDLKDAPALTSSACPIFVPDTTNDLALKRLGSEITLPNTPGGKAITPDQFAQSALVEISWGDNTRTFRVDVYNPYHIIQSETP